ncbi:hypothetical protein ACTXT7_010688 [Hymenolepis weldensis]
MSIPLSNTVNHHTQGIQSITVKCGAANYMQMVQNAQSSDFQHVTPLPSLKKPNFDKTKREYIFTYPILYICNRNPPVSKLLIGLCFHLTQAAPPSFIAVKFVMLRRQ